MSYSDFSTVVSVGHDLYNCTVDRLESCKSPFCSYLFPWSDTSSPMSYNYSYSFSGFSYSYNWCYYGSAASTCSAIPSRNFRRFCPCLQSDPTSIPSKKPTVLPTPKPTIKSTPKPTPVPTSEPTLKPTRKPTFKPTRKPTQNPTREPTPKPTLKANKLTFKAKA